jgi:tRNA-5-methyluridine54 2-sulfurtransferase
VVDVSCSSCNLRALHRNQGTNYCRKHFLDYFENKVFKTIKKYGLLERGDKVCVAVSGGKDSLAALCTVGKYCRVHSIDYFALAVDEGISGYRDSTLDDLAVFCKEQSVKLHVVSFKERIGSSLDDLKEKSVTEFRKKPCTVCGIFRRSLLNKGSRELGASKLVTGHNLDDEAQTFLMNLFQGNMSHNAKLGPLSGIKVSRKFVPRVKPLYFLTEKETRLYCFLKGFQVSFSECPNVDLSFRIKVRDRLNEIAESLPNAKYGIIHAFLEVLPDLKRKYENKVELVACSSCGEPSTNAMCNACILEEKLCLQMQVK